MTGAMVMGAYTQASKHRLQNLELLTGLCEYRDSMPN